MVLLWGLRYLKNSYLLDEFIELTVNHPNFYFFLCLSQEKILISENYKYKPYIHIGRMTELINLLLEKNINPTYTKSFPFKLSTSTQFYLCGGRNTVEIIKTQLLEKIKKRSTPSRKILELCNK